MKNSVELHTAKGIITLFTRPFQILIKIIVNNFYEMRPSINGFAKRTEEAHIYILLVFVSIWHSAHVMPFFSASFLPQCWSDEDNWKIILLCSFQLQPANVNLFTLHMYSFWRGVSRTKAWEIGQKIHFCSTSTFSLFSAFVIYAQRLTPLNMAIAYNTIKLSAWN